MRRKVQTEEEDGGKGDSAMRAPSLQSISYDVYVNVKYTVNNE
jgi:hypothetical protein